MKLDEIIKTYRSEHNISMQELADRCGLSKGYISMLENDFTPATTNKKITPSVETVKKLSAGLNIPFDILLKTINGDVSWDSTDEDLYQKAKLDFIRIPLYGPICCGNGGFNEDNIIEYVPVPSAGLNSSKEYFCQYAEGDSMKEKIEDGDLLVFEKNSAPELNTICCFCTDDNTSMCKMFVKSGSVYMLKPLNSAYDSIVVDSDTFRCIGKLKKIIRSV